MARPNSVRNLQNIIPPVADNPALTTDPIQLFADPKGINSALPLSNLDINTSPFASNLRTDESMSLRCRAGTVALGPASVDAQVGALLYRDKRGGEFIVRFTASLVQVWNGASWTTLTGPALGLNQNEFIQATVWNDSLLFVCSTGQYQANLAALTYALVATAPGGKHITTFGGHVIVSYIYGSTNFSTRLQWSAKNDNTDWTSIGSGFEDLLSSPGGVVDIQHGLFPVNDQEAVIVRSNSVWLAQLTGQADAPYQFYYLYGGVKCDSPYSIAGIPGGVMCLSRDNVTMVQTNGPTPVGDNIRSMIFNGNARLRYASASYDSFLREYRLAIPQKTFNGTQQIFRYRLDTKQWFVDEYPYQVKRIEQMTYEQHVQIGQLTGRIQDLVGPVEDLGANGLNHSGLLVQQGIGYTMREDYTVTTDADGAGGTQNISIELQSGLITKSNVLDKSVMQAQEIELSSTQAIDLTIEYRDELGAWLPYSTVSTGVPALPTPYRALKYLQRKQIQLRLRCANGGALQIISWFVHMIKGSRVNY